MHHTASKSRLAKIKVFSLIELKQQILQLNTKFLLHDLFYHNLNMLVAA
jgi:hypothetical protein